HVLHREDMRDVWLQDSLTRPAADRLQTLFEQRRNPAAGLSCPDSGNRGAPEQQMVRGHDGRSAAHEADDQNSGASIDAADRLVEEVATDRIEDNIGAAAARQLVDSLTNACRSDDHMVGAILLYDPQLVRIAAGPDDRGAKGVAHLYRCQPDTAAGAVHEQCFARPQPRALRQGVIGSVVSGAEPGGSDEVHPLRYRPGPVGGHHDP